LPRQDGRQFAFSSVQRNNGREILRFGRELAMMTKPQCNHAIEPYLAGLKFPADKDHVLEAAMHNHAPKDVLDLVEHLQRQNFIVPQDVIEAFEQLKSHHPLKG
jgi:hypothetical protein